MNSEFQYSRPLTGVAFGGRIAFRGDGGAEALIAAAERQPDVLPSALAESGGLLLLPGLQAIAEKPDLLVRLSRLFGPEVEDYRQTLTAQHMVHPTVPEIFVV